MSLILFNIHDPLATTSLEKSSMVLHLKMKFAMDEVSIKSLTKTDVILPADAKSTIQCLYISKLLFCLILRKNGVSH